MKLIKCSIGYNEVFLILAWRYSCWSIVAMVSTPGTTVILGYFLLFCIRMWSVSSVARLWLTLCDFMDCSTPGFPVHHQLPELELMSTELVMPSNHLTSVVPFSCHLQSFPASGAFPMSHFFTSGGQSIRALASVLPMNIQDWFLWDGLVWSPCSPRDSQESSLTAQFKSINSLVLSYFYSPTLTSIHDYWKNHSFV